MKSICRILFTLSFLVGVSCAGKESLAAPDSAVVQFHEQLNEGHCTQIYAAASDELKKATTEQDFVKLLSAVHSKLGATRQAQRTGWNVGMYTSGTSVTLTYATEFESGKAAEQFVYGVSNRRPLLVGYHINSNDLITK